MLKYHFHRGLCYPLDINWYGNDGHYLKIIFYIELLDNLREVILKNA
jgi:hypothetical protein